jgi:hypothetical protein
MNKREKNKQQQTKKKKKRSCKKKKKKNNRKKKNVPAMNLPIVVAFTPTMISKRLIDTRI